jgi:hypothetical protein
MSSDFCITAPLCAVTPSTPVVCCIIDAFGSVVQVHLSCIGNFTMFECTILAAEGRSVLVFNVELCGYHTVSTWQTVLAFRWKFLFPSESNFMFFFPGIHKTTKSQWPLPGHLGMCLHKAAYFNDFWYLSVHLCGACQEHPGPCMPPSFFWFDLRTSPDHSFLISVTLPPHFSHFCLEYGDMKFLRNLHTYLHVILRFKLLNSQLQ